MRHGKKFNHLSRKAPHRKAMLSNMATSLILHKRITTTVAKAKALRKYVEPLLTKAKEDTTHSRRVVFSYLNDKQSVQTLFDDVATKIADRPGGYTRILKTGNRLGDNAEMCIIELVDYNELLLGEAPKKSKTRRSRRGKGVGSSSTTTAKTQDTASVEEANVTEEVEVADENVEQEVETRAEVVEELKAEADSEVETTDSEEVEAKADEEVESKEDKSEDSGENEEKKDAEK